MTARESPTLQTYTSSFTRNTIKAQEPALFAGWLLVPAIATFLMKSSSVDLQPWVMAFWIFDGNSGCKIILLCKLSLRYSAHL